VPRRRCPQLGAIEGDPAEAHEPGSRAEPEDLGEQLVEDAEVPTANATPDYRSISREEVTPVE